LTTLNASARTGARNIIFGADSDMSKGQQIIDAHFHLWALDEYRYPWLQDEEIIPFRYGNYGALRKDYLLVDYGRDSAAHEVVAAVHM
jgi:predicted TIM-barrel fold metal-dependent hydrolase